MRLVASLLILAAIPTRGIAQSTASLGRPEPTWSVQFGVGTSVTGESLGRQSEGMHAALISLRRMTAGSMALRIDGWFVQRKPSEFAPPIFTYDAQQGHGVLQRLDDTRFFALVVAGAFPMRLASEVSVEPVIGLGVVPFARGIYGQESVQPIAKPGKGVVLPLGVSLRIWRFSIEHHLLMVYGADDALGNGENAPLMVTCRVYPW